MIDYFYERHFGRNQESAVAVQRANAHAVLAEATRTPQNHVILDLFVARWPYAFTASRVADLTMLSVEQAETELVKLSREKVLRSVLSLGARWYEVNTQRGIRHG